MVLSEGARAVLRPFAPPLLGFAIGFIASVPIAGPTAAMVFKHGIQGDLAGGRIVAFGSSLCEACYAGVAYHFFGLVSSKLDFLLPLSKVLGAVILTVLGIVFTRYKPDKDAAGGGGGGGGGGKVRPLRGGGKAPHGSRVELSKMNSLGHGLGQPSPAKGARPPRRAAGAADGQAVFEGFPVAAAAAAAGAGAKFKDDDASPPASGAGGFRTGKLLLGMSLSGLNPGLLASYGGVISTVYASGWLQFTALRAVTFGLGAMAGINAWFGVLLRLLEKYKDSIRPSAVKRVVRLMGWALLLGGLYLARGAYVHFFGAEHAAARATALQDEAKIVEDMARRGQP